MQLSTWFHRFFPVRCLHCSKSLAVEPDYLLCHNCLNRLRTVRKTDTCGFCSVPLIAEIDLCLDCRIDPPPYASLTCPWWYSGAGTSIIQAYKFGSDAGIARYLAQHLKKYLQSIPGSDLAILCPVPASPGASWQRGYNVLERILRHTKYPWARLLYRRAGQSQKTLNRQARLQNIKAKIYLKLDSKPLPPWVILVDDVHTTGATVRACSTLLREAGVGRIDVFCFFRD
jgi:ComF family protein